MSNIEQRLLSGFILAIGILASILYSEFLFKILLIIITVLMYYEWYHITKGETKFLIAGIFIILTPVFSLYQIYYLSYGKIAITLYAVIIASVDTFAMFFGKIFGGPKFAPRVSPNKTWSGFFGGVGSAVIISIIGYFVIQKYNVQYNIYSFILASLLIAIVEQYSDLFISFFKRKFHVKDSGSIIPGHGGVLDRFDGVILTAPLLLLLLSLSGNI